MYLEEMEPRTDPTKSELQDSRGCSGQDGFHYFFGQQAFEFREE